MANTKLIRATLGEVEINSIVNLVNQTRLQSCFKFDCIENRQGYCTLRYISVGRNGECTWFKEREQS